MNICFLLLSAGEPETVRSMANLLKLRQPGDDLWVGLTVTDPELAAQYRQMGAQVMQLGGKLDMAEFWNQLVLPGLPWQWLALMESDEQILETGATLRQCLAEAEQRGHTALVVPRANLVDEPPGTVPCEMPAERSKLIGWPDAQVKFVRKVPGLNFRRMAHQCVEGCTWGNHDDRIVILHHRPTRRRRTYDYHYLDDLLAGGCRPEICEALYSQAYEIPGYCGDWQAISIGSGCGEFSDVCLHRLCQRAVLVEPESGLMQIARQRLERFYPIGLQFVQQALHPADSGRFNLLDILRQPGWSKVLLRIGAGLQSMYLLPGVLDKPESQVVKQVVIDLPRHVLYSEAHLNETTALLTKAGFAVHAGPAECRRQLVIAKR